MNKIELQRILQDFDGDYNDLYRKINILDKESTSFDSLYYNEIVYLCMFLYHLKFGIETLDKNGNIPKLFDRVETYEEFKMLLNEYKKIEFHNILLLEEKNMFQEIWRLAEFKLLSRDSWTKVYSSSIYKKDINEEGKLYLSVDNKDLYQFACLLTTKSLKEKILDFEFKINNDFSINRRDNVVIYFTKENLNKYLSVIDQIIEENPSIQINAGHMLGHTLSNGVVIAKDYKDGSSFTEKVCNAIIVMKKHGYENDQMIDLLDEKVTIHLTDVLEIVNDQTKKRK